MTKKFEAPQSARGYRRWLAAVALAGVTLGAACEGDNLFTGTSTEFSPQLQGLSLPPIAYAGESLSIRIDAAAARGVSQILLSLAGAIAKDTVVTLQEPQARLTKVVSVPIPAILTDTVIVVQAAVVDQLGDVSGLREGRVVVFGPPAITSMTAPAIARLGELVSVRVTAFGARRITHLEVVASGAVQKDTTVEVIPPRTNVTQDIVFALPGVAQDTLVKLSVNARDEVGQGGAAVTRTIPLIVDPPSVELVSPPVARAGMTLDLQVAAQGVRRITEVRVELRGAVTKDVTVPVAPTQSNILQNIAIPLPGDIRTPELRARAAVIDRGQVIAWSEEDLITVPVSPPVVLDVETPLVAYRGRMTDVRVRAQGDRPIKSIEVRFRGQTDATVTENVDPQSLEVVRDFEVDLDSLNQQTVLTVMVTATDVSGAVSEIVTRSISVEDPSAPALAIAAPRFHVREVPFAWDITTPAVPAEMLFTPMKRRERYFRP